MPPSDGNAELLDETIAPITPFDVTLKSQGLHNRGPWAWFFAILRLFEAGTFVPRPVTKPSDQ